MSGSVDTATYPAAGEGRAGATASAGSSGLGLSSSGWLLLKMLVALALVPMCLGFTAAFSSYFVRPLTPLKLALFGSSNTVHAFWTGVGVCAGVLILLWRPVTIHVFLHEVTHALATWLCLGSVTGLAASAKGGKVTTNKTNFFIRLAPYCLPLPTILLAATCFLLESLHLPPYGHPLLFAGVIGAGHAFFVGFTLWSMRRDQPDLLADGWFFSITVIWLCNVIVLAAVLGLAFYGSYAEAWAAVRNVCISGWEETVGRYQTLGKAARSLWIR